MKVRGLIRAIAPLAVALLAGACRPASEGLVPVTSTSRVAVAHFQSGRVLMDEFRLNEAIGEFAEALDIDPAFAQARALQGLATPGPAGLSALELAFEQSVRLPEAERTLIEALLADRRGGADALAIWKRLASLAPRDWRVQAGYGRHLLLAKQYAVAVDAFGKATQLKPDEAPPFYDLGQARLRVGDATGAVEALRQYASLAPDDPNAQDALAEALMAEGRFDEAEAGFRRALEISPRFWRGWQGVAYTKFFSGDWASGRAALRRARDVASRWADMIVLDDLLAWESFVEGDLREGFKRFDALARAPEAQSLGAAIAALRRAIVLVDSGEYRRALVDIGRALDHAEGVGPREGVWRSIRHQGLRLRVVAEARSGNALAAQATAAVLERDAAASSRDPDLQSSAHLARGMAALARRDLAGARLELGQCLSEDWYCRWQLVLACERAGDRLGAGAARRSVLRLFVRDPMYLYVRSKLRP